MVQVSDNVGTAIKGSIKAVSGSGMASMSEASMLFQPRMLEPSKPRPSLKEASSISLIGMLKCCQVPKVSTNLTSTILAPFFFAISNTLLGVLIYNDRPTGVCAGFVTRNSPLATVMPARKETAEQQIERTKSMEKP